MCLIVLAWQVDATCPLIMAANRDEFHERPTAAAHWWQTPPTLFAGRDLRSGGTWCGADTRGRVAAVTNVRESGVSAATRSRGALVADYFVTNRSAVAWAQHVAEIGADYGPFNLVVADCDRLCFVSNRDDAGVRDLSPGIWSISNAHWGERWPKNARAEHGLAQCIDDQGCDTMTLFDLLADSEPAPDADLPDTGMACEHERILSPVFIQRDHYGTRASTVIRRSVDGRIDFHERGFTPAGRPAHFVHQNWTCST